MLYRINYTDETKACFTGLLGMIFNGKRENDFFKLDTLDGELLFEIKNITPIEENSVEHKIYLKRIEIYNNNFSKKSKIERLHTFMDDIKSFVNIKNIDDITKQFEIMIKHKDK